MHVTFQDLGQVRKRDDRCRCRAGPCPTRPRRTKASPTKPCPTSGPGVQGCNRGATIPFCTPGSSRLE